MLFAEAFQRASIPCVRNVLIENVNILGAGRAGLFRGLAESPITDVRLKNVVVRNASKLFECSNVDKLSLSNVHPSLKCKRR